MSDHQDYLHDKMFYDENVYRPEVRLDDDGFYRWRCVLDKYHDRKMYRLLIRIDTVLALAGLIAGFLYAKVPAEVLREDPSRYSSLLWQQRLIYALLGFFLFFTAGMLLTGLIRLIEGGPSKYWYRMNDEFIQIQPSGRASGITRFNEVKRAELYPEILEIRLISRWGKCPVLVRQEDFETVKEHILAHVTEYGE